MDYTNFFGMQNKAFTNVCRPEFYYESYDHIEALNRLIYLVDEGNMGFGMLTGEIGCGKTMTRQVLKERLAPKNAQILDIDTSV
jgi:general secretion pathway protein A